jgi:acyl-CoA thioesterase-1
VWHLDIATTSGALRFLGAIGMQYREIYRDLSTRANVVTAPLFPPGVMGHPDLVLPDRIHPNARDWPCC